MPACREDGASEVRRQLTLLSRLRQLLGRVKNQLDDDGENISRSRLRELKVGRSAAGQIVWRALSQLTERCYLSYLLGRTSEKGH